MRPLLRIQRLAHAEDLELPAYATDQAAGLDLRAAVEAAMAIEPGQHAIGRIMWRRQVLPNVDGLRILVVGDEVRERPADVHAQEISGHAPSP